MVDEKSKNYNKENFSMIAIVAIVAIVAVVVLIISAKQGIGTISYGYDNIELGQAVNTAGSATTTGGITYTSCTDSDGGKIYRLKGTVTYTWVNGSYSGDYNVTDRCSYTGGVLNEYYCLGTTPLSLIYTCPYGCYDGACMPNTRTTTDPRTKLK
ncbi:hypothetical protein JXB28_05240 [Candidatus Woesearchaeota archaeon]|nr:hypothetical protein [Candidatus Woesearchaeota archaeon]